MRKGCKCSTYDLKYDCGMIKMNINWPFLAKDYMDRPHKLVYGTTHRYLVKHVQLFLVIFSDTGWYHLWTTLHAFCTSNVMFFLLYCDWDNLLPWKQGIECKMIFYFTCYEVGWRTQINREENEIIVKFDVQKACRVVHKWCHQIEYRPLVTSHFKKL